MFKAKRLNTISRLRRKGAVTQKSPRTVRRTQRPLPNGCSRTEGRFRPQGIYAIAGDSKRGILSNAGAVAPHIHDACRADIEAAFTQPGITDEDVFAWFYREGVKPHVPQLPEQQVIEVRV